LAPALQKNNGPELKNAEWLSWNTGHTKMIEMPAKQNETKRNKKTK
jgi:hypothetical protein